MPISPRCLGLVISGALAVGCAGSAGDEGMEDDALHGNREDKTFADRVNRANQDLDEQRLETDKVARALMEMLSDKKSIFVDEIPRLVEAYRLASANACALLHAGTSIPNTQNAVIFAITCRSSHEAELRGTINGYAGMKRDFSPDHGWYTAGLMASLRENYFECYMPWVKASHYERYSVHYDIGPEALEPSQAVLACVEAETERLEENVVTGIERNGTRKSSTHQSLQTEVKLVFDAERNADAKICEAISAASAGGENSPGPEVSTLLCRATLTTFLGHEVHLLVW
jgi:hypothetical protein